MPPHLYELSRRPGANAAAAAATQERTKDDVLCLDATNLRSRSGKKKYFMLSQSAIVPGQLNSPSPSPSVGGGDGSTGTNN